MPNLLYFGDDGAIPTFTQDCVRMCWRNAVLRKSASFRTLICS